MKIIRETHAPFAVKGGGHTNNPGFSSTTGIHIAMRRFSKVIPHVNNQTVDVGSGLIWDDVYSALEPYNINVVGGRVSGVGVAGFMLGGGYSWKSNQFGLAIDNALGYEVRTEFIRLTTHSNFPTSLVIELYQW
jgi:FAD/FMN-containing dehydrogenase